MNNNIKLLIVDDEQLIRTGLSLMLDGQGQIEVVGQAENGQVAYNFVRQHSVDCVLMDIRMPKSDGIEAVQLIKNYQSNIKIIMLTTFQDADYISRAMQAGASGYLLKDTGHQEIIRAIHTVLEGNLVFDGQLNDKIGLSPQSSINFDPDQYQLTPREMEIIQLVATGLSNQEIADELFLSIGTIKNNITIILHKLNLRDRTQLAIFAFEKGLR